MVFLAITPKGLSEALNLGRNLSPIWCGSDAIGEAEYSNLRAANLSRFIYPLSGQSKAVIEDALATISEHHPGESIWVESQTAP